MNAPFSEKQGLDRPDKFPEPNFRGDEITADRYISEHYAKDEWNKVFRKTWYLAGMAYQLDEPGVFINIEAGSDSIICVRGDDQRVRAFYNSCPHRGTRITGSEEGFLDTFTCPYHGWQFDKQGETIFVPNEEDFSPSPCGTARLKEIRCTELFGFIWFNMSDTAPDLEDYLGATIVNELNSYQLENTVRVLNMTADSPCNWKIITDNFNESYHVQVLHPGLIPYIETNYKACQFDLIPEGHGRGWFPSHNPSILDENDQIGEHLAQIMEAWELDPSAFSGKENRPKVRKAIQAAKRKLFKEKGYLHYEPFSDYQFTDYVIYNIFPNTVITVGPDGTQLLRPRPHPSGDPKRCLFDHWWLVPKIAGQTTTPSPAGGPDLPIEDAEHDFFMHGEKSLGVTADEDLSIAKIQQEGLESSGYQGCFLAKQECRVQHFHEVLNDYMNRD